jgi:hypothetical protein
MFGALPGPSKASCTPTTRHSNNTQTNTPHTPARPIRSNLSCNITLRLAQEIADKRQNVKTLKNMERGVLDRLLSLLSSAHLDCSTIISRLISCSLFLPVEFATPIAFPPLISLNDITIPFSSLLAERVHDDPSRLCFFCSCLCALG